MKKYLLTAVALVTLSAAPAFAGGTHFNIGFYTPAPVYYQPPVTYYQPPVTYYQPAPVYYAPPYHHRVVYRDSHNYHRHHREYVRGLNAPYGHYAQEQRWHDRY